MGGDVNRGMEILANPPVCQFTGALLCGYCARSSLLYAPATLILAVLAYYSALSSQINLICVLINVLFFSFSIGAYILHGF